MHNEEILSRLMRKQEYADKLKANMNKKLGQKSSGNLLGLGLSQQSVKSTTSDLSTFITKLGPLQRVRSNPVIDLESDGHSTGRSTASNHRGQGIYTNNSAYSLTGSSGHEGDEDKVSYDLWLETWKYNQLAEDLTKGKKPSLVPSSDAVAKMLSKQVYISYVYIYFIYVYIHVYACVYTTILYSYMQSSFSLLVTSYNLHYTLLYRSVSSQWTPTSPIKQSISIKNCVN